MASLRLAYAPAGAAADRLGIAGATRALHAHAHVSHSAASDMTAIEQEGAPAPARALDDHDLDDFNSVFVMIRNEPCARADAGWESIEPEPARAVRTMFAEERPAPAPEQRAARPARRQEPRDESAVKKFGSAKSISSAQFFGESGGGGDRWGAGGDLSRFEGSSSISSAELFGGGAGGARAGGGARGGGAGFAAAPDLDEVRESVRAGVTRVAGRLSSLANGVVSSIQERYGY